MHFRATPTRRAVCRRSAHIPRHVLCWLRAGPSHRLAEPWRWELPLTYEGDRIIRYAMPFSRDASRSSLPAGSVDRLYT